MVVGLIRPVYFNRLIENAILLKFDRNQGRAKVGGGKNIRILEVGINFASCYSWIIICQQDTRAI